MSNPMKKTGSALAWLWRHTAAGIAVILIIAALVIGYRLGQPEATDEPQPTSNAVVSATSEPRMYTCSMHPSVRLPDPDAKCPICFMDLIPVAEDSGEGSATRVSMSDASAAMSGVETARVARFFPSAETRLYGKVTYDETSVARLTAYFPGRIERLFVNFVGVPVAEGDHIAEVYSPELLAAFEELRQSSQANAGAGAMSELVRQSTRDTLVAARERLRLWGLTEQQISAIEAGDDTADTLTIFAPIGGVVTNLAVREGDYMQEGTPIATVADLSRLWLDLEAYESQLPMLRWGQPVRFTVEAHPGELFEGRISFIEPLVDERTRTAAVRVAVDNTERRLKPGMFASAVIRPKLGENGAVISNELAGRWVSPMHPTVVKDEPGSCDVCGMDLVPAESLGIVGDPSAATEPLVIPRSAVLFTGTRSVVYVAVPNTERPTFEAREVVLGPRAGDFYIVRSGLSEGDQIVVSGAFRIDSAMQIAAKPSMMMPSDHAEDATRSDVPEAFIFSLKPVYSAYLDAQEALADDDLEAFLRAAGDLQTALGLVEEAGLLGETLAAWRRNAARLRITDTPADIDSARARFETMSTAVIALEDRFGHHGTATWHVAYCPMAFDNAGAEWLQRGEQIDNPYFGASMLRCGEIRRASEPIDSSADRNNSPGGGGQ